MARMHGSNVRVWLGTRDVSADLTEITPSFDCELPDATTFGSEGWKESDVGQGSWTLSARGFHNTAEYTAQIDALIGENVVVTIADGDGDTGDKALVLPESPLRLRSQPITIGDLIKLDIELQGSARPGLAGAILAKNQLATSSSMNNDSTVNFGAAGAYGWIANIHASSVSGTWQLQIQHAPDGSTWAERISWWLTASSSDSYIGATALNQYVRARWGASSNWNDTWYISGITMAIAPFPI